MKKYIKNTLDTYLCDAASDSPAPGGGSVSALAGALACSMGEMAANFTTGKKKFANVREDVEKSLDKLKSARRKLSALIDEDALAYSAVTDAQTLPKNTEEEKKCRKLKLKEALEGAMRVPLDIMRQCGSVAEEAQNLAQKANPYLITDVGVCAIMAEAACAAGRLNVEVNLKYLKDPQIESDVRREVTVLCDRTAAARKRVLDAVFEKL